MDESTGAPMAPEGEPGSARVVLSAGAMAAAAGVSIQSIANYRKGGMPTHSRDGLGWFFDRDLCLAWIRDNRPSPLHGGTRERAGRKRRDGGEPTLASVQETQETQERAEAAVGSLIALGVLTTEAGLAAALAGGPNGMSVAEARRRSEILTAAADEIELRTLQGVLLDKADVKASLGELLTGLRTRMEEGPERLMPGLAARLRLDDEQQAIARAEVESWVRRLLSDMAGDPLSLELEGAKKSKRKKAG